jgi:hypothetical protein
MVVASMPPDRRSLIMIGLYALVVVAAYVLTRATMPATIVIGVGAIMATEAALRRYVVARTRQLQAADIHATEDHFIELTPEGLRAWCKHVDSRYEWADIPKVTETAEFYLFLRGSGNGFALPKRLLTEADNSAVRSRIRELASDHGAFLGPDTVTLPSAII